MNISKRKQWMKAALWLLITPILIFVVLMTMLYIPPVQNFMRQKATTIASEATGMHISVERLDLRFPLNLLIHGVKVINPIDPAQPHQQPDTLLNLQSLNLRVQALPLFKGKVEIDEITLKEVNVNSAHLIDGMQLKGTLGTFFLESHGIDLTLETIKLNNVELNNTHLQVILADTTLTPPTPEDSTALPLNWKINLGKMKLENVSVDLQMPRDTMHLTAHLGNAQIIEATANLKNQIYGWQTFSITQSTLNYNTNTAQPTPGFDPAHIALRDINLAIDSVNYNHPNINAIIRQVSMNERSGLSITSLTGQLFADSTLIRLPQLTLQTPHSQIDLTAQTYWQLINIPTTGRLTAQLNARIGKQDLMMIAGTMPQNFKNAYPFHPLVINAGTDGNLKQMQISQFNINLPGAFTLSGGGELRNINDTITRAGNFNINLKTQDLNFLTALASQQNDGSMQMPNNMNLEANMGLEGTQCTANLKLKEQQGTLALEAAYNLTSQTYHANLDVDQLQINHFLPKDSIYNLTATLNAKGVGLNIAHPQTKATIKATLKELQYKNLNIAGINLETNLKSSLATLNLTSDNQLLKMKTEANMRFDRPYLDGKLKLDVEQIELHKLGIAPKPMKRPFAFNLGAEARHDSIKLTLKAGDLDLQLKARSTLKKLTEQTQKLTQELIKQIDDSRLNHAAIRQLLPSAAMRLTARKENPVSYFLATKNISFNDLNLRFALAPTTGINGNTAIHALKIDSLQLDTIFFKVQQDTVKMKLQAGVINGPKNPHYTFKTTLTGEVRNQDADLIVNYIDAQGETGVLFGVNAQPLTGGNGNGNGVLLNLIPKQPIIAFRNFEFVENSNWIYLHKNMRVYANINMQSNDGLRFRMQSDKKDTLSLQNINLELSRFNLNELSGILPYMPHITGLFSAEAKYIQTPTALQVSAEANIEKLTYEKQHVGNIGMGATWLPGSEQKHYLNTYLLYDGQQVMAADGILTRENNKDTLEINTLFEHFPLKIADAFVPNKMATFTGDIDGEIKIYGSTQKPQVRGDITLDSVSVYAPQAGARYWFDNRPLQIKDNKLIFDKFAIYTTSTNPFTMDGNINFGNLKQPTANLNLLARNYTLLDAPRTKESLVYGKVFVDLNATVRGPLDALTMRGNMNLLGNTNVTYVLTDSPLTVEDRLDGLVTFTSFRNSNKGKEEEVPTMSLGGMEMFMSVHIDDAVRLRADLSPDRSKFLELEGGGDLNMQYSPQGDLNLTGRYTLSGGVMKYSLPIIPLKEFQFNPGSYVDWRGNVMNPALNLKATERIRSSVANSDGEGSRMVNFDVSIAIKNKLSAPQLLFDIAAPDDATVENELQAMGAEERSKQAITMLATGIYLNNSGKSGGLTMGAALNSVLQSQINSLAGNIKGASFSVGIEDRNSAETGDKQTDYSFRYSQRLFNDRVQIIIGGKVTAGNNATNNAESFIDNISVEYRLDVSGTRYVRVFYDKNNESILDGEITETGVGLVMRRKMDKLSELFIFKKKRKNDVMIQDNKNQKKKEK